MSQNYDTTLNKELSEYLLKVFAYTESLSKTQLIKRNCPVCGSAHSNFFVNNGYLDYVRCTECSLVFMNPSPSPLLINEGFKGDDELVMEYFRIRSRHRNTTAPERPDPERDGQLCDIYQWKKSGRLIDIGCSYGDFLRKASHFYLVEGLEVNPLTAEIASQNFTIHRHYLQETSLGQAYDIVTLHQIMYGVSDPVELFSEIHKILKHDGILYVNTPNADSFAMRLYKGKTNHLYGYTTQNVFCRKSLEVLAAKTGFRIRTFRTEWLDIYLADLIVFLEDPEIFIHKKNVQVSEYEDKIRHEDEFQKGLALNLADRGNYLVAVLEKI
jgi:SAM-dependent methyltransferase